MCRGTGKFEPATTLSSDLPLSSEDKWMKISTLSFSCRTSYIMDPISSLASGTILARVAPKQSPLRADKHSHRKWPDHVSINSYDAKAISACSKA
ncbi:hypothetical protein N7493_004141 [Penicillium malachiteum]|uniref:Uncharacterized protein n=1 Tax=Penicillium malachiteum TaxID=1324776 RepID=A0AAD6HRG1_9EURO|nr:hypothetical protein N7493_004141 [Penicillium malachiteum]